MEDFEEAILTGLMFFLEPKLYPMIHKSTILKRKVAFG